MDKKMIQIENSEGIVSEVELVTYLIDDTRQINYVVYSKGEKSGNDGDEVIYISRVYNENGILKIEEIKDEDEWLNVQRLLKMIANS